LASCGDDKTIFLFDLNTQRQEAALRDHTAEVKCVCFLTPHPILVSSCLEG